MRARRRLLVAAARSRSPGGARRPGRGRSTARSCGRSPSTADPYAAGPAPRHRRRRRRRRATSARPAAGVVSFAGTTPGNGQTVSDPDRRRLHGHAHASRLARRATRRQRRGGRRVGTVGPSGTPSSTPRTSTSGSARPSDDDGYLDPLAFLPPRLAAPPPRRRPAAVAATARATGAEPRPRRQPRLPRRARRPSPRRSRGCRAAGAVAAPEPRRPRSRRLSPRRDVPSPPGSAPESSRRRGAPARRAGGECERDVPLRHARSRRPPSRLDRGRAGGAARAPPASRRRPTPRPRRAVASPTVGRLRRRRTQPRPPRHRAPSRCGRGGARARATPAASTVRRGVASRPPSASEPLPTLTESSALLAGARSLARRARDAAAAAPEALAVGAYH